jgi:hypothetical protein
VLSRFFKVYTHWQWPLPVMLCDIEEDAGLGLRVWDARKNPGDRSHLMPIITPAYPSMNSSYNVTDSTLTLMMEQFSTADTLCGTLLAVAGPQVRARPAAASTGLSRYQRVVCSTSTQFHRGNGLAAAPETRGFCSVPSARNASGLRCGTVSWQMSLSQVSGRFAPQQSAS